jgi:hypothetical protein
MLDEFGGASVILPPFLGFDATFPADARSSTGSSSLAVRVVGFPES